MKFFYARFYGSLNDFLGVKKNLSGNSSIIQKPLLVNQTVKDFAESLQVPHTEISMILANSNAVDFDYIIDEDDFLSYYPSFSTLDISQVTKLNLHYPLEMKFILDVHLGKLAKYLRLFGFDTKYNNDNLDFELIEISLKESRILLTRDLGILKNSKLKYGYFLRSNEPIEQIKEIVDVFRLKPYMQPFTRCLECNGEIKATEKELILSKLEPKTIEFYNEFFKCNQCHKIYWKGSHWKKMESFIKIFE